MGNMTLAREDARAAVDRAVARERRPGSPLCAARAVHGNAVSPCVAIATLTAAIGLNTTIFTIFNALVLAPWPVADPSQRRDGAQHQRRRRAGPRRRRAWRLLARRNRLLPRALPDADGFHRHPQRRRRPDARRRRHAGVVGERQLLFAARRRDDPRPGIPAAGGRYRVAVGRGRAELRLLDPRARPRSFSDRPHAGVRRRAVHGGGGDGGALHRHQPGPRRCVAADGIDAARQARRSLDA